MSLSTFVARVGVNPMFIAAMAHAGVANFVVTVAIHHVSPWIVAPLVLGVAAWKEFWFDARNEVPKQTFEDNLTDWLGYAAGTIIALLRL